MVFLTGLQVKTSPKTDCCVAILFLPSKKNSSRMPSWHPPDSDSVSVQDDESIIKVHNDAKHALAGYGHLASGLSQDSH